MKQKQDMPHTHTEKMAAKRFEPLDADSICRQVGRDITYEMQEKETPPILGRDDDIDRMLVLLSRQGMSNLILTGDPGVGKTVLIEALTRKILQGEVPAQLQGKRIIQTTFADIWGYVANSENWAKYIEILKKFLSECKSLNAIIFIDEIHTIFCHNYTMQYLRPYLSNGDLTIIGATTDQEYFTFIDKDRATARRFRTMRIKETDDSTTSAILDSIFKRRDPLLYNVTEAEKMITYLVSMTNAYIPYEFQPSKAIGILDEVIAGKAIAGDSSPMAESDIRRAVCKAIGIPEEAISAPKKRLEAMEDVLNAHILGQKGAIAKLGRRLYISKAALSVTPDRPDGVFMLAGPTGVGKTELAKVLASYINGSDRDLIRIDMSALSGPGSIYTLIGFPGSRSDEHVQDAPLLTLQLRSRPYSVLLLDEIEKAHPSVHMLFLHAFDSGRMLDNLGNEIYFRNTIIIMTTNLGFSIRQPIIGMPGQNHADAVKAHEDAAIQTIKGAFPPEFLGRVDDILIFKPLTSEIMRGFVGQKVRLLENITGKKIILSEEAIDLLCKRGFHQEYGARDLNRAVDDLLGYKLAIFKLSSDWEKIDTIHVRKVEDRDELENEDADGGKP